MHLELVRHAYLSSCTLGSMRVGALLVATLERPWIPNRAGPGGCLTISCVPDGTYELFAHHSDKFPNVYAIQNPKLGVFYQTAPAECGPANHRAWGRTAILLHGAMTVQNVIGCIGLGMRVGFDPHLESGYVLERSVDALDELRRQLTRVGRHTLEIRPTSGTAV